MRPRKKITKVNTTIFLLPAQRAALARISERRDVSMGHLIREAITLMLKREQPR